jgi:hypothetical protein
VALTFYDVVLETTEPDMVTPLDGEWTLKVNTVGGTLIDTSTGKVAMAERTLSDDRRGGDVHAARASRRTTSAPTTPPTS